MTNRKIVSPSDRAFSYMGRIDFSKPDSPLFIYAGSMVSTKFTGTSVGMMIFPHLIYKVRKNHHTYRSAGKLCADHTARINKQRAVGL